MLSVQDVSDLLGEILIEIGETLLRKEQEGSCRQENLAYPMSLKNCRKIADNNP
jgi:hypothetical protein